MANLSHYAGLDLSSSLTQLESMCLSPLKHLSLSLSPPRRKTKTGLSQKCETRTLNYIFPTYYHTGKCDADLNEFSWDSSIFAMMLWQPMIAQILTDLLVVVLLFFHLICHLAAACSPCCRLTSDKESSLHRTVNRERFPPFLRLICSSIKRIFVWFVA